MLSHTHTHTPLKLMSVVVAVRPCVAVACTGSVVWWSVRDEREMAPHFEIIGPSPNGMMGSSSFTRLYGSETCSQCLDVHSPSCRAREKSVHVDHIDIIIFFFFNSTGSLKLQCLTSNNFRIPRRSSF